jgi:hypothetical protein
MKDQQMDFVELLPAILHLLGDLPPRNIFQRNQTIDKTFISLGHMDSRMNTFNKKCHHRPNLLKIGMTSIKDLHPGVQVTTLLMELMYNLMTTNLIHNPTRLVLRIHRKTFEGFHRINHLV